ncbi:actin-related protein 8 isoform X3 [Tachypleus tridentatus]|uniref:actin-related protein 8 isoform X3 n=1 Tax=Tachypleus tridentatus TaxID=6853 RepID=UPI003FD32E47
MAPILNRKPIAAPSHPEASVGVRLNPIQATATVVIHPGSMFLRIGRASDTIPQAIPHVIARRRKTVGAVAHEDSTLIPAVDVDPEAQKVMEETRVSVTRVLSSCLTSEGQHRHPVSSEKIQEYNQGVKPKILAGSCDLHWTKVDPNQEFVIGEEVLYLNPSEKFNVHWPIRRGRFNLHSGVGGTLTSILSDLEVIWGSCIQQYLDIPLKDLKHYGAVLVVPDIYDRHHVKETVNLLLNRLCFSRCFIHLESVCATFGAGLSYACVVDVGDQKTVVSCVEDGISHTETRLCMEYGGSDVTQLFHFLLKKCGFPWKDCNPSHRIDFLLLQELKENLCHINLDIFGIQERAFQIKQPELPLLQYKIKVGDDCLVAPLGYFHPELFALTGTKKVYTLQRSRGDPEDPHDEDYLVLTQRRGAKDMTDGGQAEIGTQNEDSQLGSSLLDDEMDTNETAPSVTLQETERELQCDQLLGVDQAIIQSIDLCDSDDLKRKMFSCILVVGGGLLFSGVETWLYNRLSMQIPILYRGDQLDIITQPKDMDPRITTWKGAAIMSCLDTAQELWIRQGEWQRFGVRMLRERAPFTCHARQCQQFDYK